MTPYATIYTYLKLDNEIYPRLIEINRIKDYFMAKTCKRETISKAISKYTAAFD